MSRVHPIDEPNTQGDSPKLLRKSMSLPGSGNFEVVFKKEPIMNTARILSVAAFAAFASLGAQAGELNGNLYGTDFEAHFTPSRTRAEVVADASKALPNFKNFYLAPQAAQPGTVLTRSEVRAEGRVAVRAHELATGNFS